MSVHPLLKDLVTLLAFRVGLSGGESSGWGDEVFGKTATQTLTSPVALGKFLDRLVRLSVKVLTSGAYGGLNVMKSIKGPFLVFPSPGVCFPHTFPASQSPPTRNIFHLLEPFISTQLVNLPSPETGVASQPFLSSPASPWYVLAGPSLPCPAPLPPQSCPVFLPESCL